MRVSILNRKEGSNGGTEGQKKKTNRKKNLSLSAIILNINKLNCPIKMHKNGRMDLNLSTRDSF